MSDYYILTPEENARVLYATDYDLEMTAGCLQQMLDRDDPKIRDNRSKWVAIQYAAHCELTERRRFAAREAQ